MVDEAASNCIRQFGSVDRYYYTTSAAELAAAALGGLVQVETIFESAQFQRSKLKYDELHPCFCIEFQRAPLQPGGAYPAPHASVRHAQMSGVPVSQTAVFIRLADAGGRGLHSSTFWLNKSALCGIGGAVRGCS